MVARLVDVVASWVFAALVASPWIGTALIFGDGTTPVLVTGLIFAPAAFGALLLYESVLMARKGEHNGQTLGKQLVRIRVVPDDPGPMTFGTAVLRDLVGKNLPGFVTGGLYGLVDFAWPLFERENRALHDLIARTHVFKA